MTVSFLASAKASWSGIFYGRAKLWTYSPFGLFSHRDNDDFCVLRLGLKYVSSFTRVSNYRLVSVFSLHPITPFVSASSACCRNFLSKAPFWSYHSPAQNSAMALRVESQPLSLQSKHHRDADPGCLSSLISYCITPCTLPSPPALQNPLEGWRKHMFLGLTPRISDSVSLRWDLEILRF